jgi:hypothetical protein
MISLSYCNKLLDTGFSIITVGNNKRPNTQWKKYQTEQITKQQLEKNYNIIDSSYIDRDNKEREIKKTEKIGICTGFFDVECIDIDLKVLPSLVLQNEFWNEYISFLRRTILDFDKKTVIYKTLSGGYHILYRCKKIGGNTKLAKLKGYTEAIIETRGIGGYIVVYDDKISENGYHNIKEISELDRDAIINCSLYYDYKEENKNLDIPQKQSKKLQFGDVTPWDDYNQKTNIFDIIGNDFDIVDNLSDKYIIRRIGATSDKSGFVYKNSNCMYLFTTGTIYDNEKLYSPFSAYTKKYHNDNFSLSTSDLYKQGFGSRVVVKPDVLDLPIKKDLKDLNFPIEIFPIQVQNYMIECNQTLDSSIEFMGASFLWLLSVIIGNSCKIEVKRGWYSSANIWIACVGKAGLGKTPSINNIIFPLKKINNEEIKRYIKQSSKYEAYEALDKKEKENAEVIKKPIKTQFIVNDVTIEALVELHEENKNSIGVFKDELAGWFKDMNKYRQGSDLEFWLSSWSNQGVTVNRKTAKNSFVESPVIPVLGGIQPSILTQFFTEENKDNGFIDRMLLVFPHLEIEKYNSNEIKEEVYQWYSDFIIDMYQTVKTHLVKYNLSDEIEPNICKFSDEAKKEWERIYNKITDLQNSDDESEYFKSMLPKQKDYITRFSLILNILESMQTGEDYLQISKKSILDAEKLSDYFINESKKIKYDSIEKNEVKKVIKANETKSKKDQAIEIFKTNPSFKKSEIAEILGISRQLVNKYLKDAKNES